MNYVFKLIVYMQIFTKGENLKSKALLVSSVMYERELSSCPEILATTNVTIATTNTHNRAFQPYQFSNQIQSNFNPTRQGRVGIRKISLTYLF